ncbi:MAG: Clp protease ClpP [Rikenellaceae bacterium]
MESIKIRNSLEYCQIDIEGMIGVPEEWQFQDGEQRVATYEGFRQALQRIEELEASRVVVNIRSSGGDVNDALLIYEALISLDAAITTRCYGYVASAATIIAQAASEGERLLSPNSLYLIHNSSCQSEGSADDLEAKAELLRKTDRQIAELYARRSGLTAEEYLELMQEEGGRGRWLSAAEAIEYGLADGLTEGAAAESESAEPTEEEQEQDEPKEGAVQNIWRKISSRLGIKRAETPISSVPTERRNIMHEKITAQSKLAFDEEQQSALPSKIKEVEDPLFSRAQLSANGRAYDADIKKFYR